MALLQTLSRVQYVGITFILVFMLALVSVNMLSLMFTFISETKLINVGSGQEVTIKELVSLLVDITSYKGEVVYDSSMPDGNPRKLLDSSKLNEMGWNSSIDLDTGLENTYKWFMENEFKL